MSEDELKVFALRSSGSFGQGVVHYLDILLQPVEERDFEDGEHKTRSLASVRNCDVYVIQSLYDEPAVSVNNKLCRLLFFIGSLHDAGAVRVTVVVHYLCFARKDRKTKSRDPITTKYLARLFEAVGTDAIITIDVHNLQAYQNAYHCNTENLEAKTIFVDYFSQPSYGDRITVMSPNEGGVKRAQAFCSALSKAKSADVPLAKMFKQRSMGVVSGEMTIYGEVAGRTVLIVDDMISSGTMLARAATACMESRAEVVYAVATHGIFAEKANQVLCGSEISKVVVSNSVIPYGQ